MVYFYELVYQDSDNVGVVSRCTAQSMAGALIKVKALSHYVTDSKVFSLYMSRASIVWAIPLLSCISWFNCYHVIFGDSVPDLMTGDKGLTAPVVGVTSMVCSEQLTNLIMLLINFQCEI